MTPHARTRRRLGVHVLVAAAVAVAGMLTIAPAADRASAIQASDHWLSIVNTYRAQSGLNPITENSQWSAEAQAHSCYMLQNGIAHDEIPGRPGYTPGGDVAGNSGNVAVSSSVNANARNHIDLWMTGPFHAIGILRHNLVSSGFGLCTNSNTPTPWHSGGTLDVIRGLDLNIPRPSTPTTFPGDGATVPLHSFITEFPNPLSMCGWSGSAGLPLIAMLPGDANWADSTLVGPNGPIETCTLHEGNVSDATGRAILDGENAVIVMPRVPLTDGTYTATVNSTGGNVTWSFSVDRDGPLVAADPEPPKPPADTEPVSDETLFEPVSPFRLVDSRKGLGTTQLKAGKVATITVGNSTLTAVSANFVAVDPQNHGFITAFNCTADVPEVSTLGFRPGQVVANQAVIPLNAGKLCLYSNVNTHVVVDVNGYFRAGDHSGFTPMSPVRLLDTRKPGESRMAAMEERKLKVAGAAAPADATGVSLNVTVARPSDHGWLQVYPCGSAGNDFSTLNYAPLDLRPNSVVVPVNAAGEVCFRSLVDTNLIVDYSGYFSDSDGLSFLALNPIRLFDSRSQLPTLNESTNGGKVGTGQVVRLKIAGERGVPSDATGVSINVTGTRASEPTFLTAYPCGLRPDTSNVNVLPWEVVAANGATVKLSSQGELCIYTLNPTHIIVDITGVYL